MDEETKRLLDDHERRIKVLEELPKSDTKSNKTKSIKEFFLETNPSNDIEKTACCGYFLENYRSTSCFTAKDIEKIFREARETIPNNINYKINKCIEKAWMMEHDEKKDDLKAFVMTTGGENAVKSKFEDHKK